jgi:hypothetical protein
MNKINFKAHLLKLNGKKQTLILAELHNTRKLSNPIFSYGNIDPEKSHLNIELVSCDGSFEDKAIEIVKNTVNDFFTDGRYRNRSRGYGIEFVFNVTSSFTCDFYSLYSDSLDWLKSQLPECPILQAVIHMDEGTPHMHVILVPIVGGRLKADEVRGFKYVNTSRHISLFDYLKNKYDLTYPIYLRGAAKKAGAKLAVEALGRLSQEDAIRVLTKTATASIHSNPELFLHELGIGYEKIFGGRQKMSNTIETSINDCPF